MQKGIWLFQKKSGGRIDKKRLAKCFFQLDRGSKQGLNFQLICRE
jgi:hypothetical protein